MIGLLWCIFIWTIVIDMNLRLQFRLILYELNLRQIWYFLKHLTSQQTIYDLPVYVFHLWLSQCDFNLIRFNFIFAFIIKFRFVIIVTFSLFDKGLGRNDVLEDESSKKLSAKTVFSLSIRYLKDDLLKMSESRIAGGGLQEKDIYWVLTVPAIWNDAAKQFMREAAQEVDAG